MSAEVIPLPRRRGDEWRPDSARVAASMRSAFTRRNLTIGTSSVVHAVTWVEWVDGHDIPQPACRQGYAGSGTAGELTPSRWPVSCQRCRRLRGDDPEPAGTIALF